MGEQGEQDNGRDGGDTSAEPAAAGRPGSQTDDGMAAVPAPPSPVRLDDRPGGVVAALRRAVWAIMNVLAIIVRLITWVFAAILIVRIGLAFFATNPHNVIVEWVVKAADVLVWGFRDLFVPTDPRIGLVANDGLAALFW